MHPPHHIKTPAALWVGSATLAIALLACSRNSPPPAPPSAAPEPSASVQSPAQASLGDDRENVRVPQEVQALCELPSSPQEVPRFDYDDARLRDRGANILDDVAQCLSEGPLKGRTVTLVGRADPRGSDAYNRRLGFSRAETVRAYLQNRGVAPESLRLLSSGEQGARGFDEETWQLDRRVDLELSDRASPNSLSTRR